MSVLTNVRRVPKHSSSSNNSNNSSQLTAQVSAAAALIVLGSANSMHCAVTAHCDGVSHLGVMPYWKLSHGNCSSGADGSGHCYDWQQNGSSK
jgi:hypothetical protein